MLLKSNQDEKITAALINLSPEHKKWRQFNLKSDCEVISSCVVSQIKKENDLCCIGWSLKPPNTSLPKRLLKTHFVAEMA
jgi:hypothetical protein